LYDIQFVDEHSLAEVKQENVWYLL